MRSRAGDSVATVTVTGPTPGSVYVCVCLWAAWWKSEGGLAGEARNAMRWQTDAMSDDPRQSNRSSCRAALGSAWPWPLLAVKSQSVTHVKPACSLSARSLSAPLRSHRLPVRLAHLLAFHATTLSTHQLLSQLISSPSSWTKTSTKWDGHQVTGDWLCSLGAAGASRQVTWYRVCSGRWQSWQSSDNDRRYKTLCSASHCSVHHR